MSLSIANPEVERIAREVSQMTGETITGAILTALKARQQLLQKQKERDFQKWKSEINEIVNRVAQLPVLDNRSHEEMLYDEMGLPK